MFNADEKEDRIISIVIDEHMLGDHSGGNENYYTNILKAMPGDPSDKIYPFVKLGIDVSEYDMKLSTVRFSSNFAFGQYLLN